MNILAIETATPACAIGLRTAHGVELTRVLDLERRHTEVLAAGVAAMLHELGLVARDLDRVVVDVGPGLFTGLRVGVATAIGLSQGLGCGLVGLTSLELLAHGARQAGVHGLVVSAVDGRRGEVFVQTFLVGDDVVESSPPRVAVARDVVDEWATSGAPVVFTGDGVDRYFVDFDAVASGEIFHQAVPSLSAALALGASREIQSTIAPLYLREADAIANFTTRERRP